MGQEQSQDPHESQSDPEEPGQPDTTSKSPQPGPKSPETEPKPQRGLWRSPGWMGSQKKESPETVARTVWYQGESEEQDCSRKELTSQTVWYDSSEVDQREHEQWERAMREQKECDESSAPAPAPSSPQLLEQALSSHQLSAALSQPHAAGAQPAPSHGPGAQRREVHRSQREEEVGPDWKEGGVPGDAEKVSGRERTYSRESSEAAGVEQAGEEPEGEEKGAKGRKKRKKKRGKRGGREAKLSSSSSLDSQSQTEVQTQGEPASSLNTQSETETESEARDRAGRAELQSQSSSEPSRAEEAHKDAMHLPSQTKGQVHGPDVCDVTNLGPSCTAPEFSPAEHGTATVADAAAPQAVETKELPQEESTDAHGPGDISPPPAGSASELNETDLREADEGEITAMQPIEEEAADPAELESKGPDGSPQQAAHPAEPLVENEDLTDEDRTRSLESHCPEELPVKHSDPPGLIEASFLVEFPAQNTQHVHSEVWDEPPQPADLVGEFEKSGCAAQTVALPCEGTADVSPLEKGEGSAETTPREYLEHCSAAEMLRDQRREEEKRNELWMGEEEAAEERRSEEGDSWMVRRRELSLIGEEDVEEDEDFAFFERDKERKYNEDLIATAVAVVNVAIGSAIFSLELSQEEADSHAEARVWSIEKDALKHQEEARVNAGGSTEPSEETERGLYPGPSEEPVLVELSAETSDLADLDLTALADDEEPQTQAALDNPLTLCSLPKDGDDQSHMRTETQLQEENEPSCPVVDTGQQPEASGVVELHSEDDLRLEEHTEAEDLSICEDEAEMPAEVCVDSQPGECGPVEAEEEEEQSCGNGSSAMSSSDSDPTGDENHPAMETPFEEETPSGSTLPLSSFDSTPAADLSPEDSTRDQPPQSPDNMASVAEDGASLGEDQEHVAMDEVDTHALDTVDGWKERERNRMMKTEEEAMKEVTAGDMSQTGN